MQRKHHSALLLGCYWLCAAASCGSAADDPHVDFGESQPVGRWNAAAVQSRFETESTAQQGSSAPQAAGDQEALPGAGAAGKPGVATAPVSSSTTTNMMGAAQPPRSGSAGSAAPSGTPTKPMMMSAAGSAANSGGETKPADMTMPTEAAAVTSLQFNVTTEAVGGRYKPKNIGAIWITDSSGKLVKSLEVWARLRLRYLTKYASARAGAQADVTATATLTSHKAHMASWDLKDKSGATVPPGKYTLNAEITDADATGKNVSVPFDTSAGPTTVKPSNSAGFTSMELVLK